jgi:hypothetical protein
MVKNVNGQNVKWKNVKWDKTSSGKNANLDKRSKIKNVDWDKMLKKMSTGKTVDRKKTLTWTKRRIIKNVN